MLLTTLAHFDYDVYDAGDVGLKVRFERNSFVGLLFSSESICILLMGGKGRGMLWIRQKR